MKKEGAIQQAVDLARAEWRKKLLAESKTSVEEALAQARQTWEARSVHCMTKMAMQLP